MPGPGESRGSPCYPILLLRAQPCLPPSFSPDVDSNIHLPHPPLLSLSHTLSLSLSLSLTHTHTLTHSLTHSLTQPRNQSMNSKEVPDLITLVYYLGERFWELSDTWKHSPGRLH